MSLVAGFGAVALASTDFDLSFAELRRRMLPLLFSRLAVELLL